MFSNLEIIRSVRNAFAHAKIPITFETDAVVNVCAQLKVPALIHPYAVGAEKQDCELLSGLERFRFVCERIRHNLLWRYSRRTRELSLEHYPIWIDHRQDQILIRVLPLP
jgi:hypothetical protein